MIFRQTNSDSGICPIMTYYKILYCAAISFCCVFLMSPAASLGQEAKKIMSIEAYDMLNTVPDTYLIDVRTRAEYQLVGHPISAYLFPYMFFSNDFQDKKGVFEYSLDTRNGDFVKEISKIFQKQNNLIIICRDGIRSALAAKDLAKAGFKNVYDVEDGFEGAEFPDFEDPNEQKYYRQLARRNKIPGYNLRRRSGWQWWGLPWTYEIDPKKIYPPDLGPSFK